MANAQRLPEGWTPVDAAGAAAIAKEIAAEVCPEHPLYGLLRSPLARSSAKDEVLFALEGDRVASIHLTWSGRQETAPWPVHTIYESTDRWLASR